MNPLLKTIAKLRNRFSLAYDIEHSDQLIESIRVGCQFKGPRIWILIFAIFVASLGLNVNSTAVVIGAMLISPLMGPIMGIGLGVAILDLQLIKTSIRNYIAAIVVSVISSTVYFAITPLTEAQSELLARTSPNIYDVLIGLFGGLAGIVAAAARDKGNVVAGVAIATALMPPLCTAGYGLANGNALYFLGALYLFFINSVFISLSTFAVVELLGIKEVTIVDKAVRKRIRTIIYTIVLVTVFPSIYLTYRIIQKSIFNNHAEKFVTEVIKQQEHTEVLYKNFVYDRNHPVIELVCFGNHFDSADIKRLTNRLSDYDLDSARLVIHQDANALDITDLQTMRSSLMEDITKTREEQAQQIALMKEVMKQGQASTELNNEIVKEVYALDSNVVRLSLHNNVFYNYETKKYDTIPLLIYSSKNNVPGYSKPPWYNWIKTRINADTLVVIAE